MTEKYFLDGGTVTIGVLALGDKVAYLQDAIRETVNFYGNNIADSYKESLKNSMNMLDDIENDVLCMEELCAESVQIPYESFRKLSSLSDDMAEEENEREISKTLKKQREED